MQPRRHRPAEGRRIIGQVAEQKRPQHTFNAGADGGLLGDLGAPQDSISLDEPREILCSLLRRKPREKLVMWRFGHTPSRPTLMN